MSGSAAILAQLMSQGEALTLPADDIFNFDFTDTTTVFKDTAGLVPVSTDQDVIMRVNDKSGNGNHLVAPGTPAAGTQLWRYTGTLLGACQRPYNLLNQSTSPTMGGTGEYTAVFVTRNYDSGTAFDNESLGSLVWFYNVFAVCLCVGPSRTNLRITCAGNIVGDVGSPYGNTYVWVVRAYSGGSFKVWRNLTTVISTTCGGWTNYNDVMLKQQRNIAGWHIHQYMAWNTAFSDSIIENQILPYFLNKHAGSL